jgi:hypothetical protein
VRCALPLGSSVSSSQKSYSPRFWGASLR